MRFSASLLDFRTTPVDEFRNSGRLDDLILGLMAGGGDDPDYIARVMRRIRMTTGAEKIDAIEKFVAVCATMPDRRAGQLDMREVKMWIADIKDSPIVRDIVEIAGKDIIEAAATKSREEGREEGRQEGREEGERVGLAKFIVRHAVKSGVAIPYSEEETIGHLANAAESTLMDMAETLHDMSDFNEFMKFHGVKLPGFDA
jgi:hypothetical protein